jgi:hypothetical protein
VNRLCTILSIDSRRGDEVVAIDALANIQLRLGKMHCSSRFIGQLEEALSQPAMGETQEHPSRDYTFKRRALDLVLRDSLGVGVSVEQFVEVGELVGRLWQNDEKF